MSHSSTHPRIFLCCVACLCTFWACSDDDSQSSTSTGTQTSSETSNTTTGSTTEGTSTTSTSFSGEDVGVDPEDVVEDPDVDIQDEEPPLEDVRECDEDAVRCDNRTRVERCQDGMWVAEDCEEQELCIDDACVPVICTPRQARCIDVRSVGVCNASGTTEEAFPCPDDLVCEGAQCVQDLCTEGEVRCDGASVQVCNVETGEFDDREVCDAQDNRICVDGECILGCANDGSKKYLGCDFWGVDTPNEFGLPNVFAFAVGNVNAEQAALVRVEDIDGNVLIESTVAPQGAATLELPMPRIFNNPSTGLRRTGLRLTSDIPVAAYQFNPLQRIDNEIGLTVSSNDASLLLPDAALGTSYIVASYTHWNGDGGYASFVSIVSVEDGNTMRVVPSVEVAAGVGVLDVIGAGEEREFSLNRGEVLTLTTLRSGTDLTGTFIESTFPVSVVGGVDCAQVPVGETFCDHIEESIPPVTAWGSEYFAAKFKTRGGESDLWRVIASEDDTLILTEPRQFPDEVLELDRGQSYDFYSRDSFRLLANAPVLLVQYMTGSRTVTEEGDPPSEDGDPSMLVAVPLRQFRSAYAFFVPDTYERDWITVVFPSGETPRLDGEPLPEEDVSSFDVVGWSYAHVRVADGPHRLDAAFPFGVSVYGYDRNISYAYPGGLDLNERSPEDEE